MSTVHATKRTLAHILVAVDGRGLADEAIHAALELGRIFDARVDLLHVIPRPPDVWPGHGALSSVEMSTRLIGQVRESVEQHVRSVLHAIHYTKHSADSLLRVLEGHPAEVILRQAARSHADLVVIGAQRRTGIFDFGSTARAVLHGAPTAVWVQSCPVRRIDRILVPVDLSAHSLLALASACSLAREFQARVQALHCFQAAGFVAGTWPEGPGYPATYPIEEVREATRVDFDRTLARFDWRGVDHELTFVDGEPVSRILEHSAKTDLIVLGSHGRTGLSSAVLGNVAYAVLRRSEVPVLAIRHPERKFLLDGLPLHATADETSTT